MIKLPGGASPVKFKASNKELPAGNKQVRKKIKGIINDVRSSSDDIKTQTASNIAAYLMDPQAWKAKGNRCFLNPSFASQRGVTADSLTVPMDHVWQPGIPDSTKQMTTTITRDPMRAIIQKYVYLTAPAIQYQSKSISTQNLYEGNLTVLNPNQTTLNNQTDIHGERMIPGYDGNNYWYQVGGGTARFVFSAAPGVSKIHFRYRSGTQSTIAIAGTMDITSSQVQVDIPFRQGEGFSSTTYACFWMDDSVVFPTNSTVVFVWIADGLTTEYYGARPLPFILEDPTIKSVRIESGTMWYSNTSPEIEKSGELGTYQCAKGEATELYNSYSAVTRASGSSGQKMAALGRFSRLRNSEPSNFDMVQIYRDGTPVYSFAEYKDALTRTIKIKNLVGTEGTTQYSFAIEFVSSNQLYTTEIPIQDYEIAQIVYTILTHSEWDFENPLHLKEIARNIVKFGKNAVDKVVTLMPKVAQFVESHGPAIAKGLALAASVL